jgi:hypothetical protein
VTNRRHAQRLQQQPQLISSPFFLSCVFPRRRALHPNFSNSTTRCCTEKTELELNIKSRYLVLHWAEIYLLMGELNAVHSGQTMANNKTNNNKSKIVIEQTTTAA